MSTLQVETISHTNNTIGMTIDSTGRILTPARPAFRARIAGSSSAHGDQLHLVFETEDFDIGGNYDTSTGRFTAPVAGVYWFGFSGMTATNSSGGAPTTNDNIIVSFLKNSAYIEGARHYEYVGASNQVTMRMADMVNLSASDYVNVYCSSEFVYSNSNSAYDPVFQGYLVG